MSETKKGYPTIPHYKWSHFEIERNGVILLHAYLQVLYCNCVKDQFVHPLWRSCSYEIYGQTGRWTDRVIPIYSPLKLCLLGGGGGGCYSWCSFVILSWGINFLLTSHAWSLPQLLPNAGPPRTHWWKTSFQGPVTLGIRTSSVSRVLRACLGRLRK